MTVRFGAVTKQFRDIAWDTAVNGFAGSRLVPRAARRLILRAAGIRIDRATVAPGVFFGSPSVEVGARSFVNRGAFIDGSAQVWIGANVDVGMGVVVITGTHEVGDARRRAGPAVAKSVTIMDGSWIGAGVMILPGVTVGRGCVVAAGAVVTHDCEANGLYAGVPAKRVRDLSE